MEASAAYDNAWREGVAGPHDALTAEQMGLFAETGVLCNIPAVPPAVARQNQAAFEERVRREGGEQPHYLSLHMEDRWAWDLCTSPTIVKAAAQLLGTRDVFMLATHAFCKSPETVGFVGWCVARGPRMLGCSVLADSADGDTGTRTSCIGASAKQLKSCRRGSPSMTAALIMAACALYPARI